MGGHLEPEQRERVRKLASDIRLLATQFDDGADFDAATLRQAAALIERLAAGPA